MNHLCQGESLKTTEHKLLKQEDFGNIQRAMELYAKVLLYEMRLKHQEERLSILSKNDLKSYVATVYD